MKSSVTVLRTSRSGAAATGVPHSRQNFALAGSGALQEAQVMPGIARVGHGSDSTDGRAQRQPSSARRSSQTCAQWGISLAR